MRSVGGITVVLLCLSVLHSSYEMGMGGGKERRAGGSAGGGGGGNLGLFPFPRVGRGYHPQSDHSGHLRERDFHPLVMKRQGLIPFPRVGRGHSEELESLNIFNEPGFTEDSANFDSNDDQLKRSSASDANGGMWFGPRLGKRTARPTLLLPYAVYSELLSPSKDFTAHLGHEQDERDESSNNQQLDADIDTSTT